MRCPLSHAHANYKYTRERARQKLVCRPRELHGYALGEKKRNKFIRATDRERKIPLGLDSAQLPITTSAGSAFKWKWHNCLSAPLSDQLSVSMCRWGLVWENCKSGRLVLRIHCQLCFCVFANISDAAATYHIFEYLAHDLVNTFVFVHVWRRLIISCVATGVGRYYIYLLIYLFV